MDTFFFFWWIVNNHILWGGKRTLKATTLYFSYRHFFFNFLRVKRKAKIPPPPISSPSLPPSPFKKTASPPPPPATTHSALAEGEALVAQGWHNTATQWSYVFAEWDDEGSVRKRRGWGWAGGGVGRGDEMGWERKGGHAPNVEPGTPERESTNTRVYSSWVWPLPSHLCID